MRRPRDEGCTLTVLFSQPMTLEDHRGKNCPVVSRIAALLVEICGITRHVVAARGFGINMQTHRPVRCGAAAEVSLARPFTAEVG